MPEIYSVHQSGTSRKCSHKNHTRTQAAMLVFNLQCSREGISKVQKVILDHNHYLTSPNKSHKLRSERHVIVIQARRSES